MDAINYSIVSKSSSETDSIIQFLGDVDEEYIPKAGMTFPTLEEAAAFYKEYAKRVGFSTKIRNTNRCKETKEIKNQLITCNREEKWISEMPYVEKTNPTYGANCPAMIYVHVVKKNQMLVYFKGCSSSFTSMLPCSISDVTSIE
ncbi:hypothetical protein PIB30_081733 [Stylosanthes scabra]|uniref:FAR1 domain-containing protein n=1 Tax=Stylosanthes scabra TaxID=79078 RepID=A0ABU6ST51_9FABA|nr:hypothetical protein [Stylosanthes scabra]